MPSDILIRRERPDQPEVVALRWALDGQHERCGCRPSGPFGGDADSGLSVFCGKRVAARA